MLVYGTKPFYSGGPCTGENPCEVEAKIHDPVGITLMGHLSNKLSPGKQVKPGRMAS